VYEEQKSTQNEKVWLQRVRNLTSVTRHRSCTEPQSRSWHHVDLLVEGSLHQLTIPEYSSLNQTVGCLTWVYGAQDWRQKPSYADQTNFSELPVAFGDCYSARHLESTMGNVSRQVLNCFLVCFASFPNRKPWILTQWTTFPKSPYFNSSLPTY